MVFFTKFQRFHIPFHTFFLIFSFVFFNSATISHPMSLFLQIEKRQQSISIHKDSIVCLPIL